MATLRRKEGSNFEFTMSGWRNILFLGQQYSWHPAGTLEPEFGHDRFVPIWDGRYDSTDGQEVTAQDARALADALEKSLDDIPDNPQPGQILEREGADLLGAMARDMEKVWLNMNQHSFGFFGGENKKKIEQLIEFCRRGAFFIFP